MIIKLKYSQIVEYWEEIKFAFRSCNMEVVGIDNMPIACSKILHDLFSNLAQCWFSLDENRRITSILITYISMNKITNKGTLMLDTFYPFSAMNTSVLKDMMSMIVDFAKRNNCLNVCFNSADVEAVGIAKSLGFAEVYKHFSFRVR